MQKCTHTVFFFRYKVKQNVDLEKLKCAKKEKITFFTFSRCLASQPPPLPFNHCKQADSS